MTLMKYKHPLVDMMFERDDEEANEDVKSEDESDNESDE